jgi:hypothetical protein
VIFIAPAVVQQALLLYEICKNESPARDQDPILFPAGISHVFDRARFLGRESTLCREFGSAAGGGTFA